ncbi:MAG: SusD/RagB family nutrient-binding outer membrane lipoprotein [Cyclobacteriaceae bacterium]|nr:SusD/RagB family nutrient-binding outer membrane lipoprotein [Cyclobacteriaceae bacterium]
MKRKYRFYGYSLLIVYLLTITSCDKFLDVNNDPTKVQEDQARLNVLLPTAIEATSASHYSSVFTAARVTHQVDHVAGYYTEFRMESNWSRIYLETLNTLDLMVSKADDEGSPYYAGIARTLEAINLGLLTDTWEDAPFTEALRGSDNITPAYDSQEAIYNAIFSYLDDAIGYLGQSESFNVPGADDMIYDGDLSKWLKLAHSLKARYMLHLMAKGTYSASEILAEVDAGFASNDDNFELFYNDVNLNPLYNGVALSNETGNLTITHGKYLVDVMNGTLYGLFDPRLPIIADTTGSGGTSYEGLASYDPGSPPHTCELSRNAWYSSINAPIIMMSYSELKFIEAEVALSSDVPRADAAYLEGISSNMDMLGVASVDRDAYLTDPSVALGGTPDIEHIMKEKYVALFLNFEVWNDMRRHHFDPSVYVGFVEPNLDGRSEPAERALYPTTEQNRNESSLSSHQRDFTASMWKDQ